MFRRHKTGSTKNAEKITPLNQSDQKVTPSREKDTLTHSEKKEEEVKEKKNKEESKIQKKNSERKLLNTKVERVCVSVQLLCHQRQIPQIDIYYGIERFDQRKNRINGGNR